MILREANPQKTLRVRVTFVFALCLVLAGFVSAQTPQQTDHAPAGWQMAGSNPAGYRTGLDRSAMPGGAPSAFLASAKPNVTGFGTLMQSINSKNYLGKRVRLRGWVKSQYAADWAGLWMRVDKGEKVVSFDNMQDRGIKGTQPWNSYDIVLDVPPDASSISFGILLQGNSEVWLNDVTLEVVDSDTPTTGQGTTRSTLPTAPLNLTFND